MDNNNNNLTDVWIYFHVMDGGISVDACLLGWLCTLLTHITTIACRQSHVHSNYTFRHNELTQDFTLLWGILLFLMYIR